MLEPYLSFKIYAPQEYLSRAYNDAPKYCANIVDTQLKNNEVILSGEIPARCIQEYRSDLTFLQMDVVLFNRVKRVPCYYR